MGGKLQMWGGNFRCGGGNFRCGGETSDVGGSLKYSSVSLGPRISICTSETTKAFVPSLKQLRGPLSKHSLELSILVLFRKFGISTRKRPPGALIAQRPQLQPFSGFGGGTERAVSQPHSHRGSPSSDPCVPTLWHVCASWPTIGQI